MDARSVDSLSPLLAVFAEWTPDEPEEEEKDGQLVGENSTKVDYSKEPPHLLHPLVQGVLAIAFSRYTEAADVRRFTPVSRAAQRFVHNYLNFIPKEDNFEVYINVEETDSLINFKPPSTAEGVLVFEFKIVNFTFKPNFIDADGLGYYFSSDASRVHTNPWLSRVLNVNVRYVGQGEVEPGEAAYFGEGYTNFVFKRLVRKIGRAVRVKEMVLYDVGTSIVMALASTAKEFGELQGLVFHNDDVYRSTPEPMTSPAALHRLLAGLNIRELCLFSPSVVGQRLDRTLFTVNAVHMLTQLIVHKDVDVDFDDRMLATFANLVYLDVRCHVSPSGINYLLKEHFSGKRRLEELSLIFPDESDLKVAWKAMVDGFDSWKRKKSGGLTRFTVGRRRFAASLVSAYKMPGYIHVEAYK